MTVRKFINTIRPLFDPRPGVEEVVSDLVNEGQVIVHKREDLVDAILKDGIVGVGDAYAAGHWSFKNNRSPLPVLLDIFENEKTLATLRLAPGVAKEAKHVTKRLFARNSPASSKEDIHSHYDLGNQFYADMLGETMGYSCGIYEDEHGGTLTLNVAQIKKFDALRRLLKADDTGVPQKVLEVGCGWGYLGNALDGDVEYSGITLSEEQSAYIRDKYPGLPHSIVDYRDHAKGYPGYYDAIVSVEMIEHVGAAQWQTYFDSISEMLKKRGRFVLQSILCRPKDELTVRLSDDYIKRRVFPGSDIPSMKSIISCASKAGLELSEYHELGGYAQTLLDWRENLLKNRHKYSQSLVRAYEFYLLYCACGFSAGYLSDAQMVFTKA